MTIYAEHRVVVVDDSTDGIPYEVTDVLEDGSLVLDYDGPQNSDPGNRRVADVTPTAENRYWLHGVEYASHHVEDVYGINDMARIVRKAYPHFPRTSDLNVFVFKEVE